MTREQLDAIRVTEATYEEVDALIAAARRALELEEVLDYLFSLRSPYFTRGETIRLIETDCGAMRVLGEGATPLEAVKDAMELAKGGKRY